MALLSGRRKVWTPCQELEGDFWFTFSSVGWSHTRVSHHHFPSSACLLCTSEVSLPYALITPDFFQP